MKLEQRKIVKSIIGAVIIVVSLSQVACNGSGQSGTTAAEANNEAFATDATNSRYPVAPTGNNGEIWTTVGRPKLYSNKTNVEFNTITVKNDGTSSNTTVYVGGGYCEENKNCNSTAEETPIVSKYMTSPNNIATKSDNYWGVQHVDISEGWGSVWGHGAVLAGPVLNMDVKQTGTGSNAQDNIILNSLGIGTYQDGFGVGASIVDQQSFYPTAGTSSWWSGHGFAIIPDKNSSFVLGNYNNYTDVFLSGLSSLPNSGNNLNFGYISSAKNSIIADVLNTSSNTHDFAFIASDSGLNYVDANNSGSGVININNKSYTAITQSYDNETPVSSIIWTANKYPIPTTNPENSAPLSGFTYDAGVKAFTQFATLSTHLQDAYKSQEPKSKINHLAADNKGNVFSATDDNVYMFNLSGWYEIGKGFSSTITGIDVDRKNGILYVIDKTAHLYALSLSTIQQTKSILPKGNWLNKCFDGAIANITTQSGSGNYLVAYCKNDTGIIEIVESDSPLVNPNSLTCDFSSNAFHCK